MARNIDNMSKMAQAQICNYFVTKKNGSKRRKIEFSRPTAENSRVSKEYSKTISGLL